MTMEKEILVKGGSVPFLINFSHRGYELVVNTDFPNASFFKYDEEGKMSITSRDLKGYEEMEINPDLQYLEVGPGLGEFIPYVVSKMKGKNKPIAIDLADYSLMRDILEYAREYFSAPENEDSSIVERLDVLLGRVETITDPELVTFINEPLHEALDSHPELYGCADVVVDNFGALRWYSHSGNTEEETVDLERKLKKSPETS